MAMLGIRALKKRRVKSSDGQIMSPAGSAFDPLRPLPAMPSNMPLPAASSDDGSMRDFQDAPPVAPIPTGPMFSMNAPQLAPLPMAQPKPKFFNSDGTGTGNRIVGILADALSGAAGQPGQYAQRMERQRQEQTAFERGEEQYQRRRADAVTDREAEANRPQYFSGNEDRLTYDPVTQTTRTLYDAPTDAQVYAGTLGYQPDTPDYASAVRDYVLKSNGPSAVESRFGLENLRTDGRQRLQSDRLGVTRRGQDIASRDRQRGQDLRPKPKGKPIGGAGDGAIAVNPSTGERMKLLGGKWVPIK